MDFEPRNFDLNLIKEQLHFRPHHVTILVRGLTPIKEEEELTCQPEGIVPSDLNLKSVWITGCERSNMKDVEVQIVGEIFAKSCTTLEEVKYDGYIRPRFGEGVVFRKVKKLGVYSLRWERLSHVAQTFFSTCPNLERLEMDYAGTNLWRKKRAQFPRYICKFAYYLHFHQFTDEPGPRGDSLYHFLLKHQSTLVDLGLTLECYDRNILLPPLPVLQSLRLTVPKDYKICWVDEDDLEKIDYAKFLPKLTRLTLKCSPEVDTFTLVDSFLPVKAHELKDYVGPGCATVREVVLRENPEGTAEWKERREQCCYFWRVWPEAKIRWDTLS